MSNKFIKEKLFNLDVVKEFYKKNGFKFNDHYRPDPVAERQFLIEGIQATLKYMDEDRYLEAEMELEWTLKQVLPVNE